MNHNFKQYNEIKLINSIIAKKQEISDYKKYLSLTDITDLNIRGRCQKLLTIKQGDKTVNSLRRLVAHQRLKNNPNIRFSEAQYFWVVRDIIHVKKGKTDNEKYYINLQNRKRKTSAFGEEIHVCILKSLPWQNSMNQDTNYFSNHHAEAKTYF